MRPVILAALWGLGIAMTNGAGATTYVSTYCTDGLPAETHGSGEVSVTDPATGAHHYVRNPVSSPTSGYAGRHASVGYHEGYYDANAGEAVVEGQSSDGTTLTYSANTGKAPGKSVGACLRAGGIMLVNTQV